MWQSLSGNDLLNQGQEIKKDVRVTDCLPEQPGKDSEHLYKLLLHFTNRLQRLLTTSCRKNSFKYTASQCCAVWVWRHNKQLTYWVSQNSYNIHTAPIKGLTFTTQSLQKFRKWEKTPWNMLQCKWSREDMEDLKPIRVWANTFILRQLNLLAASIFRRTLPLRGQCFKNRK